MRRRGVVQLSVVSVVLCLGFAVFAVAALGTGVAGAPGALQVREAARPPLGPAPSFQQLQSQFSFFDMQLGKLEQQKLLSSQEMEALTRGMWEYGQGMKNSFDVFFEQARQAAESQGKQGSVEGLKSFEAFAQDHAEKLKQFDARLNALQLKIRSGEVQFDKASLQRFSPSELQQFHRFLLPQGQQQMRQLHPELFRAPAQSLNLLQDEPPATEASLGPSCDCPLAFLDDLLARPAEASLAWPCVSPCLAHNWVACVNCLRTKGPAAINAWNNFVRCWNGCRWWQFWCKGSCLVRLVQQLA